VTSRLDGDCTPKGLSLVGDAARFVELATPIELLANEVGVVNVFDDGGYRTAILLKLFGLTKNPGRLGHDAQDADGNLYELKTVNLIDTRGKPKKSIPSITTEHSLTLANISRYRATKAWLVGVFEGHVPLDVWVIDSEKLEPFYAAWEEKIRRLISEGKGDHDNNPKIPFGYVQEAGRCFNIAAPEGRREVRIAKWRPLKSSDV